MTEAPVWLITGATGIGGATARLAAQRGVRVFSVSKIESDCELLAIEIGGGFHACDLSEPGAADRAVEACLEKYGRIDALFNVVGMSGRRYGDGPLHLCSDQGWDVTLDNNLKTTFLMSRPVLRYWMDLPRGGAILNMASVLGFSPESGHFATHAYAAAKGAVIALTRTMASYYAPYRIRVNALAPALVRTPMSRRAQEDEDLLKFIKTKQPLTRDFIEAGDVARAACFLLSEDAEAITGDVMVIDGGWSVTG